MYTEVLPGGYVKSKVRGVTWDKSKGLWVCLLLKRFMRQGDKYRTSHKERKDAEGQRLAWEIEVGVAQVEDLPCKTFVARYVYEENGKIFSKVNTQYLDARQELGHYDGDGYVRYRGIARSHIVWFLNYGYWPTFIDHLSRERGNDSIVNLKESNHRLNSRNVSRRYNNTSGITGVNWHKGRRQWRGYIKIDGQTSSKTFWTRDFFEACCWRKSMEVRHGYSRGTGQDNPTPERTVSRRRQKPLS